MLVKWSRAVLNSVSDRTMVEANSWPSSLQTACRVWHLFRSSKKSRALGLSTANTRTRSIFGILGISRHSQSSMQIREILPRICSPHFTAADCTCPLRCSHCSLPCTQQPHRIPSRETEAAAHSRKLPLPLSGGSLRQFACRIEHAAASGVPHRDATKRPEEQKGNDNEHTRINGVASYFRDLPSTSHAQMPST